MNSYALNILDFWFKKSQSKQWFEKNYEYDILIKKKFLKYHTLAINGKYESWKNSPFESLAFIILIDQFSRNMFREDPMSYQYDNISLDVSKFGIKNMYLDKLNTLDEKLFYI